MTATNYNLRNMTEAMNREADMTDIKTEVNRYAEDALQDARNLAQIMETGELTDEQIDHYGADSEYSDWFEVLDLMALEVYGTARVTHTRQDLQSITVVTGTGGPHVEFEVDYRDNVTGRAYWGSDSAEKHDTIPGLFDTLAPLVEGME